jgi:archaellum component FlaC
MTDEPTGGSEHTVSQGDVSVHRTVEPDGTGVVATVELSSAADEPVLVEVAENLSDDLPVESIGFKPGAMPDGKELSDDRLRFEQAVADELEEVVYGLMLSEPVGTVAFDAPAIESVEPVAAGATERDDEPGDAAAGETTAGDTDAELSAGTAEAVADTTDESIGELPELSLTDTDDPETGVTDELELTGVEDTGSATGPEDADDHGRRSVDVRLDRLSARVEEFAAYADTLGALVDEHGTPDEFVDRFDDRIDDVDGRVASARAEFQDEVGTVREDVSAVEDEVTEVGAETDDLRDEVESLDGDLAALRGELDETSASMERVREETARLREELRELQAVRGSLAEAFAGWASSSGDGTESNAASGGGSGEVSVVSDGGSASAEDRDEEYTSAVTPVDPDD